MHTWQRGADHLVLNGRIADQNVPIFHEVNSESLGVVLPGAVAYAKAIPDVRCSVEDYPVRAVVAWQFPETLSKVQVVVLRDPAGEQEERFDRYRYVPVPDPRREPLGLHVILQ